MNKKHTLLPVLLAVIIVLTAGCSQDMTSSKGDAAETAEVSSSENGKSGSGNKSVFSFSSVVKPDIPGVVSKTAVPSDASESRPDSSAQESSKPESSAQESSKPESSVQESSEPESSVQESSEPESSEPESSEPESSAQESSEPESSAQESSAPVIKAESVNLSVHELNLTAGEQYRISFYYLPDDADAPEATYYISSASVIYVGSDSVITALSEGEATLTVKTDTGLSDSCKITVNAAPSEEPSAEPSPQYSEPETSQPYDDGKPIVNAYQYYTSSGVYRDIALLCERYPDIISSFNTGSSEKGKPITCVTLGKGEKKACVVAGLHSREHITISFTMRCIEEYAKAYRDNSYYGNYNVRELLDSYTLYIIPMCNPDGTAISTAGESPLMNISVSDPDSYKLNANGVNLNRNFPYNWENQYSYWPYSSGEDKYPGRYAASESETRAIMKLCAENDFLWLLDMHILGNGIYWRDEKNGPIADDYAFASSIAGSSGYTVFGMSTDVSVYSGGLENWFRYAYKRPALCIEMMPYSQSVYSATYRGFNRYFEDAINWYQSRYTYLAAMSFY